MLHNVLELSKVIPWIINLKGSMFDSHGHFFFLVCCSEITQNANSVKHLAQTPVSHIKQQLVKILHGIYLTLYNVTKEILNTSPLTKYQLSDTTLSRMK